MDVIVIGGGIAGVATAYQLRAAGHRVCVVERHATVAQGATYGHSGVVLPGSLDVWFGPTFLRDRRHSASGVISTLAQKREPSLRTRHPSVSQCPFSRAVCSIASGTPACLSSAG